MINISLTIKNVCKKKIIVPFIFTMLTAFILIKCPFITIFHPTYIENVYDIKLNDSYVNTYAKTLYYTGYNLIKSDNRNYGYYYTLKNDRCIFVIIPIDSTPKTVIHNYTFKAKVMKPDRTYKKMITAFSDNLNWTSKGLSSVTENFVLSNADYHPIYYMFFLWIILIGFFISTKKLFTAILVFINPNLYPVCTFLGRHMQKDLITASQRELDGGNYLQINSMYITENFFIDLEKLKVSIIPLNKIVWCYRLGTMSLNPKKNSPEYSLHFTILSGAVITAEHKTSDEALEVINAIRATDYDIIIGHSDSKRKRARKLLKNKKTTSGLTD